MLRFLTVAVLVVAGAVSVLGQDAEKPGISSLKYLGRTWNVKFPDSASRLVIYGEAKVVVANRTFLQTQWQGGEIELGLLHMDVKKNDQGERLMRANADNWLFCLRGKGEFWDKRSFEPKGELLLRIRAGTGDVILEVPPKEKDGAIEYLAQANIKPEEGKFALEAGKVHSVKIVDAEGSITVFINGKEILKKEGIAKAGEGNVLSFCNRERNAGDNVTLIVPPPK